MITLLLSGVLTTAALADTCRNDKVQDINCNNISVEDEVAVDLSDPVCAAVVDAMGESHSSADYYVDYAPSSITPTPRIRSTGIRTSISWAGRATPTRSGGPRRWSTR